MGRASRRISICYSTFVTTSAVNLSAHSAMLLQVRSRAVLNSSVRNLNITFNMDIVWQGGFQRRRDSISERSLHMATQDEHWISLEEYHDIEQNSEAKYEYSDGHIYEVSGVTFAHSRISLNLLIAL